MSEEDKLAYHSLVESFVDQGSLSILLQPNANRQGSTRGITVGETEFFYDVGIIVYLVQTEAIWGVLELKTENLGQNTKVSHLKTPM
jgi:hypothetical protein